VATPARLEGPTCGWCGHREFADVYQILGKKIIKCAGCRLMQAYPMSTPGELAGIYTESYFTNPELTNPTSDAIYGYYDYLGERLHKQEKYKTILRTIRRYLEEGGVTSRDLLDIGCGYGFFLDSSVDFGFTPTGLEYNAYAIDQLRSRYAFTVLQVNGTIEGPFPAESFACVAVLDTIEHLRDPFGALDSIRAMLRPKGIVAISTMDSTSFMSRLMGSRLEDFRRINEHLYFFDRRTIRSILDAKGFDVLEIKSIGHTFEAGLLFSRISASLPIFRPLASLVRVLRLEHLTFSLNPRTKMIAYARKR
jgi:2-polyprenyl-3-methyl-5-hydroxy-6-metoxy-1,4-benzoquinol methylase